MTPIPPNQCRYQWIELTQEWELDGCNCHDGYVTGDPPSEPGSLIDAFAYVDCYWVGENG